MKKKISVGLVLALVLVMAVATALAVTLLWEDYAVQAKQTEREQGTYASWPVQDKIDLIKVLVDNGHMEESDETRQLFDPSTLETDAHRIADQMMLELTQEEDVRDINFDVITYSIMGFFETWTPEQRVWWQQITNMNRHPDMIEKDTLVQPGPDDLPEAEVVEIARKALIRAYELPEDYFDHNARAVADLYVTEQRPDYRRWNIMLQIYREDDSSYIEKIYCVVVDNTGTVIADPDVDMPLPGDRIEMQKNLPGRPTTPLFQTIDEFALRENEMPFRYWSQETQAEYSEVVSPQVRAIVDSGDLTPLINGMGPDISIIASATYTYGMPGEQDIKQGEALDIAKQAIRETYGLDSEDIAQYERISVYFDITNPDEHLWKFVFPVGPNQPFVDKIGGEHEWFQYKVEIASRTGEVAKTEEFAHQLLGHDLDYELKLH